MNSEAKKSPYPFKKDSVSDLINSERDFKPVYKLVVTDTGQTRIESNTARQSLIKNYRDNYTKTVIKPEYVNGTNFNISSFSS